MIHKVISKQSNSKDCFICGKENPGGLQADFYELDDQRVACVFTAKTIHEGHPGILHGGMICSILDETAGRAMTVFHPEVRAFTVQLDTTYKAPVPSNTRLTAVGWLEEIREKVYIAHAAIYLADGRTAATARGVYYIIKDTNQSPGDVYHKVYPSEQDIDVLELPDERVEPLE